MIKNNISLGFENVLFPVCKLAYSYFEITSQYDTQSGLVVSGSGWCVRVEQHVCLSANWFFSVNTIRIKLSVLV